MAAYVTYAIIFVLVFLALGGFALYLARTIDHGEARFDTRNPGDDPPDEG